VSVASGEHLSDRRYRADFVTDFERVLLFPRRGRATRYSALSSSPPLAVRLPFLPHLPVAVMGLNVPKAFTDATGEKAA